MRSVTTDHAAAILSPVGKSAHRVTIDWGTASPINTTVLSPSVSVERSVDDLPDETGLISGSTRGNATITLGGKYLNDSGVEVRTVDLSPFRNKSWSVRDLNRYGMGRTVTVDAGVIVNGAPAYVRVFTGTIRRISQAAGDVSIDATDAAGQVRGKLDVAAAGIKPGGSAVIGGDLTISPLSVVELALRSAGLYLTPPLRTGVLVSVPNCGSPIPEVGRTRSGGQTGIATTGYRMPVVGSYAEVTADRLQDVNDGKWLCVEGWFKRGWTPGGALFSVDYYTGQQVMLGTNGAVYFRQDPTNIVTSPAGAMSNGTGYHYIGLAIRYGAAGIVHLRVDGTTYTASAAINKEESTGRFPARIGDASGSPVSGFEGFQAWQPETFNPATDWNNSWAPNYTAAMTSAARLKAIIPQEGLDAWQLIQEIAAAEGAIAQFDEDGIFRYETRAAWQNRRYATAARTITGGPIESLGISWSDQGERRSVQASISVPTTSASTATKPAFVATEVYTCPARRTITHSVSLDSPVFDLGLQPANDYQFDVFRSYYWVVRSSAVGDPAALPVKNVTVMIAPTVAGIDVTITNPNSYEVALWTPTAGSVPAGPYLIVHGITITVPQPRMLTRAASSEPTVTEDLVLPDNTWRQDEAALNALLKVVAAECRQPPILFEDITIKGDPRIQLGDVVALDDSLRDDGTTNPNRSFDTPAPCLVVGIRQDMPANGIYKTTLTLRSAYRPTGWILGVPGRTELGISTRLV